MGLNYKNLNPCGLYFAFLFELETEKKFNPSLGLKSKKQTWNQTKLSGSKILRGVLCSFKRDCINFQPLGGLTWMRQTGCGIPTFWICFHPVNMDMQTLLHKWRHCYWQKKRNQKRQYQNTTNIAWIIHADCACYHCVLKKLSSEFHAPTHDFNQPIYCTIFGREKNQGQIANTNSHNFNCSRRFYICTCDQFVKKKNTALHFINNC